MIRINLVSRRNPAPVRVSFDRRPRVTAACCVILTLAVVEVGWRIWSVKHELGRLSVELQGTHQEIQRLEPVLKDVAATETRRARLMEKVNLIDEWRRRRGVSVHLLDELSRALPDGLWLERVEQDGPSLVVGGQALSLAIVLDFVAGLQTFGSFEAPVEIVDSQLGGGDQGEVIRFELRAVLVGGY